jgi:hypothetical protein
MPSPQEPDGRVYLHAECGQQTLVSGNDFSRLANPFSLVTQTFCVSCRRHAPLGEVSWADTGEVIRDYRRRLRAEAPGTLKLFSWFLGPLAGALPGVALAWFLAPDKLLVGSLIFGLIGAVFFWLLLVPPLTRWLWRIDYRTER